MNTLITNKWLFERVISSSSYNKEMSQLLLDTLAYNDDVPEDIKAEANKLIHAIIDSSCSAIDSAQAALSLIAKHDTQEENAQKSTKQFFRTKTYRTPTTEETTETFTETETLL